MPWVMLFALSALVGVVLTYIQPKIAANSTVTSVAGSVPFGSVLVTALGIFVALIAASFLMRLVTKKEVAV